ncbi:WXG100 family type VII secretion target [Nocardia sp. alder85J]|uniref:WXG100 family type VII secretion target n=1 Tax=Nocardia sp. alder85J TaxID=2862949 RepID=UPI001CD7AFB0|nr:WXG100 family type VII secretion target [Nocardia sp. alder85J]MCX4095810.1 WXG100 family type VII secretion target [Nocardia sp. alder85J]
MDGKYLRVEPTELRRAADELHGHRGDLQYEVHRLHSNHGDLQQTWTGASSDAVAGIWSDLHPRITEHLDRLSDHADTLHAAAGLFTVQEDENATSFTPRYLRL